MYTLCIPSKCNMFHFNTYLWWNLEFEAVISIIMFTSIMGFSKCAKGRNSWLVDDYSKLFEVETTVTTIKVANQIMLHVYLCPAKGAICQMSWRGSEAPSQPVHGCMLLWSFTTADMMLHYLHNKDKWEEWTIHTTHAHNCDANYIPSVGGRFMFD